MDEHKLPSFDDLYNAMGPEKMSWLSEMVSPDKEPLEGRSVGAKAHWKPVDARPRREPSRLFSPEVTKDLYKDLSKPEESPP